MRHLFKRGDPTRTTDPVRGSDPVRASDPARPTSPTRTTDPARATERDPHLACPHARHCEMFELLRAAGTLKTWQIRYCGGNYQSCARHEMAAQGRPVPPNLLPSGQLLRFAGGNR